MNLQDINADVWAAKLAGALVSMRFLQGSWPERALTALAGAVLSYYTTDWLAAKVGLPLGLTGFLLGLFGMAVMSRAWEWVQATPVARIWDAILGWFQRKTGG
jgi:hypothetical protein